MVKDVRPVIISGPSGAGKSTICSKLVATNPLFKFAISHTTRKQRCNEIDGVNYHFISKSEFELKIRKGEFLEYAIYNGNYYGTSTAQLENVNHILLLDLDRQGVQNIKKLGLNFRCIFVYVEKNELKIRLENRIDNKSNVKIEDILEIESRLNEFDADMLFYKENNYDLIVENTNLERSMNIILNYIFENNPIDENESEELEIEKLIK